MSTDYTLHRPHPDHVPFVNRVPAGRDRETGNMRYATSLRCSCGWKPGVERDYTHPVVVSPRPPSRGGRTVASTVYRQHLRTEGVAP